jgi:HD superfamily phosphohydrolase YqeK
MAVFVADKIRWDQPGDPPYLEAILAAVERSLPAAAFCYLDYLWQRRETLLVVHPWLVEAHQQLAAVDGRAEEEEQPYHRVQQLHRRA